MAIVVKKLFAKNFISNSYLLCNESGTYIVDPSAPIEEAKRDIESPVLGILLTHGHSDHMIYLKEYINEFNCPIYCHKKAIKKIENDELNLSLLVLGKHLNFSFPNELYHVINDGDIIKLGLDDIKVLYTPGHTDCSVVFQFANNLITGDTLFYHTIGRTAIPVVMLI